MHSISSLLLFAAGIDPKFVEQSHSEKTKYLSIGASVLFTGIFSALAAGYALQTVFESTWLVLPLALLWGLMIFNLDRLIIAGMRKNIWWREWLSVLPRLFLAGLISLVISRPLELRLFANEISAELQALNQEATYRLEKKVRTRFDSLITIKQMAIKELKLDLANKAQQKIELNEKASQEADGTGGSRVKNLGPIYKLKKAAAQQASREYDSMVVKIGGAIDLLESEILKVQSNIDSEINALENVRVNGFPYQNEALVRLTENNTGIWWAHLLISLLFFLVEITPILVKLLAPKGPYDAQLAIHEHQFQVNRIKLIATTTAQAKKENEHLTGPEAEYLTQKLDRELI